ncbi:MAG: hypothetical protein OXN89_02475 [Bryobacterales bacterium]|nr:hypothetical protein [Bryobacterales bacterium]
MRRILGHQQVKVRVEVPHLPWLLLKVKPVRKADLGPSHLIILRGALALDSVVPIRTGQWLQRSGPGRSGRQDDGG